MYGGLQSTRDVVVPEFVEWISIHLVGHFGWTEVHPAKTTFFRGAKGDDGSHGLTISWNSTVSRSVSD
jgi:hypothetical protein